MGPLRQQEIAVVGPSQNHSDAEIVSSRGVLDIKVIASKVIRFFLY